MRQPKQNNLHAQHPLQLNLTQLKFQVLESAEWMPQARPDPAGAAFRPSLRRAVNVDVNGC